MPSTALDYITVKGFKSIASIERLQLRPVNVLIGSNGSGKSNFVGVFAFLHAVREGRMREYVTQSGGAEKILHFGSKTTPRLEFQVVFGGWGSPQYDLSLSWTKDDGLHPFKELAFYTDERTPPTKPDGWQGRYVPIAGRRFDVHIPPTQQGREAGISEAPTEQTPGEIESFYDGMQDLLHWIASRLDGWRIYHLHDTSSSSAMRKTAKVDDNRFLRADASNLAAYLYFIREKHPTSYGLIRRTVQRVAPFFDDFKLAPSMLNPDTIKLEWKHKSSDQYFDAGSFSDGTLRFIALATLFLQAQELRPRIIIVDEPELGLHPYAIEMLSSLIRQASESTQVIVSTQSSLLLDHFDPEDVLVANRVGGGTHVERLAHTQLQDWLEDYSLGQLWEKNEFAGRPTPE